MQHAEGVVGLFDDLSDTLLVDHLHAAEAMDLRALDDLRARHLVQHVLQRDESSAHGRPDGEHAEAGDQRDGGRSPQGLVHRSAVPRHSSAAPPSVGWARSGVIKPDDRPVEIRVEEIPQPQVERGLESLDVGEGGLRDKDRRWGDVDLLLLLEVGFQVAEQQAWAPR